LPVLAANPVGRTLLLARFSAHPRRLLRISSHPPDLDVAHHIREQG